MSITFFSQGWGGKHYLLKTKEKGKQAPEAGGDYNDYGNEDGDVGFDQNDNNAVDTYDDETYDDDTNDDDTYDDANDEELDVESMIEDNIKESALEEYLNQLSDEDKEEALETIKEAAINKKEGKDEDFSNNLMGLRKTLEGAHLFLEGILEFLKMIDITTIRKYTRCSGKVRCQSNCRSSCGRKYSRSRKSSKRGRSKKRSRRSYVYHDCKSDCFSKCKSTSNCRSRTRHF